MIRLKNVNKYFFKGKQNEIHVINDISLELPQKGMVAFFGHSGCGKTTLLNAIGGLDDIKSGTIEIDGHNIRKKTDDLRNQYIGYIFQNYNLNLKVTNYENVAESLRLCGMEDEEEIRGRVYAALENVGMEKYAHRMPDTLSGGQKQRIAIARAIVKSPAIVLADEPTGNLDEANTIAIMDLLKSISREHLVLLVTHESNLVDYYCDKVIGLKDGRITEIRDNQNANGYIGRDKNVVYLGEYEKRETTLGRLRLTCYGDDMPEEVLVRIVNRDGTLLLACDSPKVKLVDASSEIVFKNGSFEEERKKREKENTIQMDQLPPVKGKHFGRLFHWKNAVIESARQFRGQKSRGNKALKRVMEFFAVIIVLLFAMAGKDIKNYLNEKESFNHNVFWVYGPADSLRMLWDEEALKGSGIDSVLVRDSTEYSVDVDLFETFSYENRSIFGMMAEPIEAFGNALPYSLAEGKKLVAGRGIDALKPNDVLISSFMAEKMVDSSKMGFIQKPEDLIGLSMDGRRIAGIVEADEPTVYMSGNDLYSDILVNYLGLSVGASTEVPDGEAKIYTTQKSSYANVKVGDTIRLGEKVFTIREVGEMPETEYRSYMPEKIIVSDRDIRVLTQDLMSGGTKGAAMFKLQVHSTDVAATEDFLNENVKGKKSVDITTPEQLLGEIAGDTLDRLIRQMMIVLVFVLMLSFCMLMIMRSSVMSRIREIGVYRCIGVTRKNMYFRFMVEGLVMATLYIIPIYLVLNGFIYWISNYSGVQLEIFLPWWISLPLMIFLYLLSIVCALLPVISLLRKTPAQIIAKYDI